MNMAWFSEEAMSEDLVALLEVIGDPDRADLLQIKPELVARLHRLGRQQQLDLLSEVTAARSGLSPADGKPWYSHQILFQLLCSLCCRVVDDEEQRAIKADIKRQRAEQIGDWPKPDQLLTPEEVAENIQRRMTEYSASRE
jgi:hypothetical protein